MWNYIITFLIGAAVPVFISWLQRRDERKKFKLERKDKYKLVAIEKRLEAHQQAFYKSNKLRLVIHESNWKKKNDVLSDAWEFWNSNCLYLEKGTRENFYKIISLVSDYHDYLENWKLSKPGPDKENANKLMMKAWDDIHELPKIIMREVELEPISIKEEKDATGENINVVPARE